MKDEKDFDALLQNLNRQNLDRYAKTHLSKEKQRKLHEILNDPNKLGTVLDSPQAKALMKKLKDKKHG